MAINPVNIIPDNTNVTVITDDKKIIISGDVVANNVNVTQPIVNTIKVQVPGPQGPVGPVGPIPTSGSFSGSFLGDVNANLVSSAVVSFTNNIDKDITTELGSHAVSMGDITIDSGSSTNIGGTWDILDSYFFTQASNKQIYGLLFDFDGAISLSALIGQNLWKNNSTAERWYNNAYQWDPNEVDSSQRGRVKIKVGLTYDKDGGNAYVRLTDVRDGVKTYLGDDWYQLTTSNPSSPIFTEFEFEGVDGSGTPFTPGGIDRYLALESFTDSGIFLGLYKADLKLTVY